MDINISMHFSENEAKLLAVMDVIVESDFYFCLKFEHMMENNTFKKIE